MRIVFDPPLGKTTHVATISTSTNQTVTLTFIARLGTQDYTTILDHGGKMQLWTDLPFKGGFDGTWREADFIQPEIPINDTSHGPYTISMNAPDGGNTDTITLCVRIGLTLGTHFDRVFQFTYRIIYATGRVRWLGEFGVNGHLVLETKEDLEGDFALFSGWERMKFDLWKLQTDTECLQKRVARIDMSQYRVWPLGKKGILSEPSAASILFIVPLDQNKSLVPIPTYILSSSHTLTISILTDNTVAISGTGGLTLQTLNQSNIEQELKDVFHQSQLHNWRVLVSDSNSQSAVIGLNSGQELVKAIVLPIWSSPWAKHSVRIPYANIARLLHQAAHRDIAILSKSRVWVLRSKSCKEESMLLMHDSTGDEFVMTLLHTLSEKTSGPECGRWAVAVFNNHRILKIPSRIETLPIQPPSSPFSRNNFAPSASLLTIPFQNLTSRLSKHISPPATRKGKAPQPSQGICGLFKSLFASVGIFLRVFLRVFLGQSRSSMAESPSTLGTRSLLPESSSVIGGIDSRIPSYGGVADGAGGDGPTLICGDEDALVGELQYDGDLNAPTAMLALIPLSQDAIDQHVHVKGIQHSAVVFMDGSHPPCAVRNCRVAFLGKATESHANLEEGSCSVLEYQLDWERSTHKSVIKVKPPQ